MVKSPSAAAGKSAAEHANAISKDESITARRIILHFTSCGYHEGMQYNRLGNSGLIVSRMAFGVMTFGQSEGLFKSISKVGQDLANELVARALDAGVNFFNTADVYTEGQSETMLGKALGARRKDAVIATKVGFRASPALVD